MAQRRHPIHSVNGRIASQAGTVQMDLLGHADALANTAEDAVRKAWDDLWELLKGDDVHTLNVYAVAHRHFQRLYGTLVGDLSHGLHNLATWSHDKTATNLAGTVPLPYLHVALAPHIGAHAFTEDVSPVAPGLVSFARAGIDLATADIIHAQVLGDDEAAREIFKAVLFPALRRSIVCVRLSTVAPAACPGRSGCAPRPSWLHRTPSPTFWPPGSPPYLDRGRSPSSCSPLSATCLRRPGGLLARKECEWRISSNGRITRPSQA